MTPPDEIRTAADSIAAAKFFRDFLGIPIIPIHYGDKRPLEGYKLGWQERGLPTNAEIEEWVRTAGGPVNLAAVYNGSVVAIDVDDSDFVSRGFGQEEFAQLKSLTMVVATGRPQGGFHIYYRVPSGGVENRKWNLPTANGSTEQLDLRACREYALLPGCKHPSGAFYKNIGVWQLRETTRENLTRLLEGWAANLGAKPETANKANQIDPEPLPRWVERLLGLRAGVPAKRPVPMADGVHRLVFRVLAPTLALAGFGDEAAADAIHRWAAASALEKGVQLQETREKILGEVRSARANLEADKFRPSSLRQIRDTDTGIYAELLRRRVVSAAEHAAAVTGGIRPEHQALDARAPPEECAPDGLPMTDYGNAERFRAEHGGGLRYIAAWGKWLAWNGMRWIRDETGEVVRRALKTVSGLWRQAGEIEDREARAKWLGFVRQSEDARRLRNAIETAGSLEGIALHHSALDADPWALNTPSGMVNIRTGDLRPARPEDHCAKITGAEYSPHATAPTWDAFLAKVVPEKEVRDYLQRAAGYSLTGDVSEQVLLFLHGSGANGKSTFLSALCGVLGDYAMRAPPNLLVGKRHESHPAERAELFGARLVVTSEIGGGEHLAEVLVKDMTGGDAIKARFLYRDFFEFKPTFKLWIAANTMPRLHTADYAIRRRVHRVPFTVTIPEAERDRRLADKLVQERAGILRWAVEGCLEWQREGLRPPAQVLDATADYMAAAGSAFDDWLASRCEIGPDFAAAVADLYADYCKWCVTEQDEPWARRSFGFGLAERGYRADKGTKGRRVRRGLRLAGGGDITRVAYVEPPPQTILTRARVGDSYGIDNPNATQQAADSVSSATQSPPNDYVAPDHGRQTEWFAESLPSFVAFVGEKETVFRGTRDPASGRWFAGDPVPAGVPEPNLAVLRARGATTRLPPPAEAATCPRCAGTWCWGGVHGWVWTCCGRPVK